MSPDNNPANHIPDDDLVLFALQLLPEDRMRQAMSHLQTCQECRSEIARIQGDLAAYSAAAEFQPAPPTARERFMRQIAREPRLAELPAFELKPTEYERREQERLAQMAPPEPPPAPVQERVKEPLADRSQPDRNQADRNQDPLQRRLKDLVENRREDRIDEHPGTVFSTRQNRNLGSDEDDEQTVPARKSTEPVFSARHSRNLRAESREEDDEERTEERRRPRRAPWVLAWTGWAVAAGCSFVAGLQFHQRQQMQNEMATQQASIDNMQQKTAQAQSAEEALSTLTSTSAMQVALHPTPAVKPATAVKGAPPVIPPEALAAYLADKGALVFVATHLQQPAAGKTYELWLLPANGQSPIPAGTFKPDAQGSASVLMPSLPKGVQAKGFGVTVENDGGSQTPTMPIVMS